ncbi:MAG: c-type cytochrome [Gemmatimonadota bacterium]
MSSLVKLFAVAATFGVCAAAHAAGDADRGRTLYQARCTACHSLDYNGVGPAHRGVYGRAAGTAPGYAYSPALKSTRLSWNDETLDRWLADPEKVAPGQRMGVNVPDAQDRADLIAYLKQNAAAK